MQCKKEAPMAECFTCGEPIPKDEKAHKRMVDNSASRQSP
jgi:DNA-directed RNA polymerase subunit N (RpoN/RPB10)